MKFLPFLLILLIVIFVGGIVFLSTRGEMELRRSSLQPTQAQTITPTQPPPSIAPFAYRNGGFFPSSRTMKVGVPVDVVIVNQTESPLDVVSEKKSFDVGVIAPGESTTIKVQQIGVYEFYNRVNASHSATVFIQNSD